MIVNFSQFNCGEKPTLVLKNLDGTAIQTLGYAFNIEADLSYNEVSTLKFELPATVDGEDVPGYDETVGMRIVDLVGCGQFLLFDPEEEFDGIRKVKTCEAYSLEYEFAKKAIYLEAGTYNFYSGIDTSDKNTIVGRIRECLPDWRFVVDVSLAGRYRTFDDISKKAYEFIKSDVQQKYRCIFNFDTYERVVYVIDVESVIPAKQIYLSSDNLVSKIKVEEDSNTIITRLDVNGADDVNIRSVNPTGTNKIYNLDYFMTTTNFDQTFIDKWRKWEAKFESLQTLYYDLSMSYNMKLLTILTKESKVADIEAEIKAQENLRSTKIQMLAQSNNDKTKDDLREELEGIAQKINDLQTEIKTLKDGDTENNIKGISDLKAEATDLHSQREEISKQLSFEKTDEERTDDDFTPEEFIVLRRYFIDDTLQDSSFVAETAATYIEQDYSFPMNGSTVSLSGATEITETTDSLGNTVVSFVGGLLNIESLSAKMIRGTLYFESDNDVVFSGYAESGTIGEAAFANGSITVSGSYSSLSTSSTSLSFAISDGQLYFTEKCSEYKQHQIEWELYEYGKQVLREKASPTYNFDVECCNFLRLEDFLLFRNQLTLGQRVYLCLDEKTLEPFVVSVHINFDDPTDFSIEFSSMYTAFDQSFHLAKLLDESVATGKTLSYKSGMYSSFVNSGASTAVKDFMDSALDIAKNAVLSSGNQAITYDDTGIRIRKWADETKTSYAPEEIWMVDNVIAFTDNNWATAKMAIGKIFDPNLVSVSNPTGIVYGIVAPYIVGTLLAGENLVIDTENGAFKVDSSGVYIDALNFHIRREGTGGSVLYDKTIGDILSENGGIDAGSLSGIIDSQNTQMKSASGNVLFDEDGLWLMDTANKESMTTAIWMNEKGISFGTGDPGEYDVDESDGGWKWTTAIGHDGIAASAIAAGQLSGMNIVGGDLKIGQIKGTQNYNFIVDSDGNVTANSGTFKGTVEGATFKTSGGTSMMTDDYKFDANYLSLKGIEIKNGETITFAVSSDTGAVTINGSVTMGAGSVIDWDKVDGKEEWDQAVKDASDALDEVEGAVEAATKALSAAGTAEEKAVAADELANAILNGEYNDGTQLTGMYIYSPTIYSPTIYGNTFNVVGNSGNANEKTVFTVYYDEEQNMSVLGSRTASFGFILSAETLEVSSNYVNFTTCNIVDFEGCDVRGLTSTAVFG